MGGDKRDGNHLIRSTIRIFHLGYSYATILQHLLLKEMQKVWCRSAVKLDLQGRFRDFISTNKTFDEATFWTDESYIDL